MRAQNVFLLGFISAYLLSHGMLIYLVAVISYFQRFSLSLLMSYVDLFCHVVVA